MYSQSQAEIRDNERIDLVVLELQKLEIITTDKIYAVKIIYECLFVE